MFELDDRVLLKEYVERGSEKAFATLVARHVNKVYSIALRHTRNAHLAEEITQADFVILARKSRHLGKRVILSGWLCRTARLSAVTFVRSEIRRTRREQEAHMQTLLNESESEVWPQIAPFLDAAMAGLLLASSLRNSFLQYNSISQLPLARRSNSHHAQPLLYAGHRSLADCIGSTEPGPVSRGGSLSLS